MFQNKTSIIYVKLLSCIKHLIKKQLKVHEAIKQFLTTCLVANFILQILLANKIFLENVYYQVQNNSDFSADGET